MEEWNKWFKFRPWQRHGLVLMVGGLVYIAIGLSFVALGDPPPARKVALVIALNMFPLPVWGLQFIAGGLLSCLSSRWPYFYDSWGYMVLCGLAAAWSAIYGLGYFLGNAGISNLIYMLIWGLVGFMWWAISGLVNPAKEIAAVMPNGID